MPAGSKKPTAKIVAFPSPQQASPEPKPETRNLYYVALKGWYFRIRLDGRTVRRSLQTHDVQEARKRRDALLAQKAAQEAVVAGLSNGQLPWSHALGRFEQEIGSTSLKQLTRARYLSSLRVMDDFMQGRFLHEITRPLVRELVQYLKAQGLKNATINRHLTALSQLLVYGEEWGVCGENPARDFNRRKFTRELRSPHRLPDLYEMEEVARACTGMMADAVRFAFWSGGRQSEIFALKWVDIDLEHQTCQFVEQTKFSKNRAVRLPPQAVELLAGLPRHPTKKYVFWHGDGYPYRNPATYFAKQASRARERNSELLRFRFHDLRHAFAVRTLIEGGDIYDLSRHLGHASVQVTERYLGYVPGGVARAVTRPPRA